MDIDEFPEAKPVFDDPAVEAVLVETELNLTAKMKIEEFREALEDIARHHYWNEAVPGETSGERGVIQLDAIANASVTPSRLRNRLIGIERSSRQIFAGTSRRPLVEKVEELLDQLGRKKNGTPMRISGTETTGHGGSESSTVWLCLIRAVAAAETPPKSYRPGPGSRPWPSQRLEGVIQSLVQFIQSPDTGLNNTDECARALHGWVEWCIPLVEPLVASTKNRHDGNAALNITISKLHTLYGKAFERRPSLYRSSVKGSEAIPNAWERFLRAVLTRILFPVEAPTIAALGARWRRLTLAPNP
jgi:hypothetical protein